MRGMEFKSHPLTKRLNPLLRIMLLFDFKKLEYQELNFRITSKVH